MKKEMKEDESTDVKVVVLKQPPKDHGTIRVVVLEQPPAICPPVRVVVREPRTNPNEADRAERLHPLWRATEMIVPPIATEMGPAAVTAFGYNNKADFVRENSVCFRPILDLTTCLHRLVRH